MAERMKGMQAMMDAMKNQKTSDGKLPKRPQQAPLPTITLMECIPAEFRTDVKPLTSDGGCMIRMLTAGGGERPKARAKCNFEWQAHYIDPRTPVDPTQPDWRECPGQGVRLGKQFKLLGWELGLAEMAVGDIAEVYCAPKYCDGFCDIQMTLLRLEHASACPGGAASLRGCPACNPELTAKQVSAQQ